MKKDTLSVSNVVDRLTSPTPPFWRTVRKIGLWITGAAAVVVAAGSGLGLPAAVITVAKVIGAVSTVSVVQAQATKIDDADGNAEITK